MILALLLACGGGPDKGRPGPTEDSATTPPTTTTATVPLDERVAAFREAAAEAGFTVQDGRFGFLDYSRCCLPGASCLWNNPSTPYGLYAVPPAPGQTAPDLDVIDGMSQYFHLREDEALVLLGTTPPPSKYFSFRSYKAVSFRPDTQTVIGSLGASTNIQTVAASMGTDAPFDAPMALVTSMDGGVEADVHALLAGAGFPAEEIHDDRIVRELVEPGLDLGDDLFMSVTRIAVVEDPARSEALYADPPWTLLRLTPTVERPADAPHPRPDLPPRGDGTNEALWADALDTLDAAVVDRYAPLEGVKREAIPHWFETLDCVEERYCSGDIRDRWYARVQRFPMPDERTFAVVIGVNHERTGKASYSNFAVDTVRNEIGLSAVNSRDMVGTAQWLLPDHPQADDLYAWVVARDCTARPEPHCIEVPYGCPGVEPWEYLFISFRAYLEPSTGAAPSDDELVLDRVYWFTEAE